MIRVSPIELILIGIPETFLIILVVYSLSSRKIPRKIYAISSIVLGILNYFIRMLPINFGVHTILFILLLLAYTVFIIKIHVVKAISYVLATIGLLSLSEVIVVAIMINLFKINFQDVLSNPLMKSLYGIPHLFMLFCSILVIRRINKTRRKISISNALNEK